MKNKMENQVKKMMKEMKERMRKIKNSGCMSGWDREHFRREQKRSVRLACHREQTFLPQVCGIPPHAFPPHDTNSARQNDRRNSCDHPASQQGVNPVGDMQILSLERAAHQKVDRHTEAAPVYRRAGYTEAKSRIVQIDDHTGLYFALLPTLGFLENLQDAVVEQRDIQILKDEVYDEQSRLAQGMQSLEQKSRRLECEVGELENAGNCGNELRVAELRDELESAAREREEFEKEMESCGADLEDGWMRQRSNLAELFTALDEVLIDSQFLQQPGRPNAKNGSVVSASRLPTEETRTGGENTAIMDGLNAPGSEPEGRRVAPELMSPELLRYRYQSMRMQLRHAQDSLDDRLDVFDDEADKRRREIDAGESVEPQLELDMRQFKYTQDLTRQVIEAEAAYQEAKTSALAAGVELSDVSTGFPDHPEDGHRLSSEEQMAAMNPVLIQDWVNELPDSDIALTDDNVSSAPSELSKGVELDQWDAMSIDICDSYSLVADEPWRGRIDTWRSKCSLS